VNSLAILLLSVVPTADTVASADELTKAVTELKSGESKLRSSYDEFVQGQKKLGPITNKIKDVNHDMSVLQTELLNVTGTSLRAGQARANLRERIRGLEKQKSKLEGEFKSAMKPVEDSESAFHEEEKKVWESTNKALTPLVYALKIGDDKKGLDAVSTVFDLFIFDDHKDAPNLKPSGFLDQEVFTAVGKCLATGGTKQLPNLKKWFEKSTAMKYAAVLAVTEIGPPAKAEKDIVTSLNETKAALLKNKTLPKSERDARLKVVEKAIDAIK
jgi:hypothetical protein